MRLRIAPALVARRSPSASAGDVAPAVLRAALECLRPVFGGAGAPSRLRAAWEESEADPDLPPERLIASAIGLADDAKLGGLSELTLGLSDLALAILACAAILYGQTVRIWLPFTSLELEIPFWAGMLIFTPTIWLSVNALNCNDGVDGLSGTLSVTGAAFAWSPGHPVDYGGYVCAIVKVTRLCNLRCTYCHDWREGPGQVMTFPVQARLFAALMGDPGHGTIDIVWHGGESTMIGRRQVLRMLYLQRVFARPGQTLKNRLQTNGTRLDDAWVRLLGRYDFGVGLSLDGPAEIHDRSRVDAAGGPTFAAAARGLRLVREAGLLSHVYLVVTEQVISLGAEAVLAFLRHHGIDFVGMLPERPANRADAAAAQLARER